jgi:hypothetical protein
MNRAEFEERFRTAQLRRDRKRKDSGRQEPAPRMIIHFQRDYYAPGSTSPLHRAGKTVEMPEAAALILIDLKFAKPAVEHWERR